MIKVQDIVTALEEFAPRETQMSYDNAGLQVGLPQSEVSSVLLTIDVTQEVLEEAIQRGCTMVVAHHPLIFHGLMNLTGAGEVQRMVAFAIKHDLAVYAGHTNVDVAFGGVSWRLGSKWGLQAMQPLEPSETLDAVYSVKNHHALWGSGVVGTLPEPVNEADFLQKIKDVCGTPVLRHSALLGKPVRRVAVCGGSGSSLIPLAIRAGADVYVSADFKYHDFALAERRLVLVDAGHFETEQFTKEIFYEVLTKKFPNFAVCFSQVSTNPINYC